jgi:hypothetical protein
VKQKIIGSLAQARLRARLLSWWPALKGSLALVRKPCIRPDCRACARGDKHPNYLLTVTQNGRRRCYYVPKAMVPAIRRALTNGRRIEQSLYEIGPLMLQAYRLQNPAQTGPTVKPKAKKPNLKS